MEGNRKQVIGRRFYPVYRGRINTYRSYRSYCVGGAVRSGSADFVVGTCDASAPDGWVTGVKGGYAARTSAALALLPGFVRS
jgi:hypothetical protein